MCGAGAQASHSRMMSISQSARVQAHLQKVGVVAPAPEETIPTGDKAGNLMGDWGAWSALEDINY